ncbi:long-chain-fatty-acid--CoA ligase [Thauera sp. Sel9]|uniref:long-chain-fatty-acid--CoA ligase n=1 Tax=Thauera sp. Sel9 TaxID=2974299 RepID=UPI0021E19715|nr:long-chain-fatty-acid--CoA ligase [Thauera sp. Sel9]MCV2219144.1 long-chain-fatty-acid--CoA ligase [Thauera sp. Sel9]
MQTQTLSELIRSRARERGDAPAFVTPARTWRYTDLDAESNRLANGLTALGVGPGDRVGCLTRHTAECICLLLACAKLGAVCAPYNWRLAAGELEYVIGHGEARVLLSDAFMLPTLAQIAMPGVRRILVIDAPDGADALSAFRAGFPATDSGGPAQPTDTVLQLCSSGTTGLPKGVELTHFGLLEMCGYLRILFGQGCDIVQLNVLPTFHVSGTVNALWTVFEGAMTVAYPEFEPERVLQAIAEHRVRCAFLVPAMMQFLLHSPAIGSADLSSLRTIAYGGSPIGEQLLTEVMQAFGCDMVQVYGATEASGTLTVLSAQDHHPSPERVDLLRSAGKPIAGVELRIVDLESFAEQPEGVVGEVWVRTRTLMKGYFRNDEATREAFPLGRDADGFGGWYRTGDAGYLRGGYLYIHDRVKDMVISGGENIYPAEVENAVALHPAVAEVAVIGMPDPVWGESVKACVVLRDGAQVSEAELLAFTRERLAHYKCPKSIDFMPELPRNPSGKLLKRMLRQRYWPDAVRPIG